MKLLDRLCDWLYYHAQTTPYTHLGHVRRFWIIKPRSWLPFEARLHITSASDPVLQLHDHPRDWCSIILKGVYYETVKSKDGKTKTRICGPLSIRFRRAETFHRISLPTGDEPVWSLFITGPHKQEWGFLVKGKKIYWKHFLAQQGQSHAPRNHQRPSSPAHHLNGHDQRSGR